MSLKKYSNIFERIEYLSELKGYRSVTELSKDLKYKSPEKLLRLGRDKDADPSYDIIADFTNMFADLNLRWFLTGEGEPLIIPDSDVRPGVRSDVRPDAKSQIEKYKLKGKTPVIAESSVRMLLHTVDNTGRENILLVPVKAQAGYLVGSNDRQYVGKLPAFWLPGLNNGTFRAFEIAGYSMQLDKGVGFSPGDIVIGEYVENPREIRDGNIYILVNSSQDVDDIIFKRCLNRPGEDGSGIIWCKSDNRDYSMFPINYSDVKEVWKFKRKITAQAPDPAGIYDRLNDHDVEIAELKSDMKRLNK